MGLGAKYIEDDFLNIARVTAAFDIILVSNTI